MNQKYIAIFLAVIMVMSILPFFFSGSSNQANGDSPALEVDGFDSIPGKHVDRELNSLADGLAVTPDGAVVVQYLNVAEVKGTIFEYVVGNTSQLDGIYGVQVDKMYSAEYLDRSGLNLHVISPEVIAFQYYLSPDLYNGYQLVSRGSGLYNVVGTPMIFGAQSQVESVLDIMEGNATASSSFDRVMEFAEPGAQLQRLIIIDDGFAEQYYFDLKMINNSEFSRTAIYLNPTEGTVANVTSLSMDASERNLVYDISSDEDIFKVTISSNLTGLNSLLMESAW